MERDEERKIKRKSGKDRRKEEGGTELAKQVSLFAQHSLKFVVLSSPDP